MAVHMRFDFAAAGQILFGSGRRSELGKLAAGWGQQMPGEQRVLLVLGFENELSRAVEADLEAHGLCVERFLVPGEPTVELVRCGVERTQQTGCRVVVGFGGGSAIDAGKAIAALATNPGEILDYLEVIGQGKSLVNAPLPYLAVPTTAGTGAEVTRNAVLAATEQRLKVSLRSPLMLPRVALVDPELTYSLPPAVTASTGLDALTQVIEPYVSNAANPLTDALCREAIRRASRALRRAYENGQDAAAREDMSLVSLFGGLALANARLGAVHGFAGVLGGMFPGPHGAICARLLPLVMQANLRAMQQRQPDHPALGRYAEIAAWLTGQDASQAAEGVAWVQALCQDLRIPGLAGYGLTRQDIPTVVSMSARASSMKGNPIALTDEELAGILADAM